MLSQIRRGNGSIRERGMQEARAGICPSSCPRRGRDVGTIWVTLTGASSCLIQEARNGSLPLRLGLCRLPRGGVISFWGHASGAVVAVRQYFTVERDQYLALALPAVLPFSERSSTNSLGLE